jgi:hypothetical protein
LGLADAFAQRRGNVGTAGAFVDALPERLQASVARYAVAREMPASRARDATVRLPSLRCGSPVRSRSMAWISAAWTAGVTLIVRSPRSGRACVAAARSAGALEPPPHRQIERVPLPSQSSDSPTWAGQEEPVQMHVVRTVRPEDERHPLPYRLPVQHRHHVRTPALLVEQIPFREEDLHECRTVRSGHGSCATETTHNCPDTHRDHQPERTDRRNRRDRRGHRHEADEHPGQADRADQRWRALGARHQR